MIRMRKVYWWKDGLKEAIMMKDGKQLLSMLRSWGELVNQTPENWGLNKSATRALYRDVVAMIQQRNVEGAKAALVAALEQEKVCIIYDEPPLGVLGGYQGTGGVLGHGGGKHY